MRALLAAVLILLVPSFALAADGDLTLLFTGDNGGEVAPCG